MKKQQQQQQQTIGTTNDDENVKEEEQGYDYHLMDMPVSNNGARLRLIIYESANIDENHYHSEKDLTKKIHFIQPKGFKEKNKAQGKFPILIANNNDDENDFITESDVIARFLISKYKLQEMMCPSDLKEETLSNLMIRYHDLYITNIQGALYRDEFLPMGMCGNQIITRYDAHQEILRQLRNIDDLMVVNVNKDEDDNNNDNNNNNKGFSFLTGKELSLADVTLYPTMIFITYIMPKFGYILDDIIPKKLMKWFVNISLIKPLSFGRVQKEMMDALLKWDQIQLRFDKILGTRPNKMDNKERTIFDKIIAKEIPSDIIYEDDYCLVIKDINPRAEIHYLCMPKDRNHLTQFRFIEKDHLGIMGYMMTVLGKIAKDENMKSYRIEINDGEDAGQTVFHLHIHLLGSMDKL